jgi:hypothetical protein
MRKCYIDSRALSTCLGFLFHLLLIGKYSNIPPKEKKTKDKEIEYHLLHFPRRSHPI